MKACPYEVSTGRKELDQNECVKKKKKKKEELHKVLIPKHRLP
jgi:hypothetical protein